MAKLIYEGPKKIRANQLFKCTLTVKIEEQINTGGVICIASRHTSDIGIAQCDNPDNDNFVEFHTGSKNAVLGFENRHGEHPWNKGFSLIVKSGALMPGDSVTLNMGGRRGFRSQSFSEINSGFRLGIKQDGNSEWIVCPKNSSEMFEITGAEAVRVRAYVKDANNPGAKKTICVKMEDAYANIGYMKNAVLDVILDDKKFLGKIKIENGTALNADFEIPADDDWHTLVLVSEDGKFHARTNPFGPSLAAGLNVYFGDIHSQSRLCDGTNMPDELYKYAKIAAGLDFASVTSHDMELDDGMWELIQNETRRANDPHKFVTILGYEWSGIPKIGGDNNVYFKGDTGPLVRNTTTQSKWCVPDTPMEDNDLAETIRKTGEITDEFIVIPHCGGRQANFGFYDPKVMPVFEIHSTHRNYEQVWRTVVDKRLKLGLVGGSDDHRGAIGDCTTAAREVFFSSHCGLICVYAGQLTRDSIWNAILKRHTYATNGPHILLGFSLGENIMGDEVTLAPGAPLSFSFKVATHGFFDRLEVYRNNEIAGRYCAPDQRNQVRIFEDKFEDTVQSGLNFYYIKALQTDGGCAWSSPIFVNGVPA